jgi:hypothetical protein
MTVDVKRTWYHACICKWIRGLPIVFIAHHSIENYDEDVVIIDIIAIDQDALLVTIVLTIPQFLAIDKASNKLTLLPTPAINCNFLDAINRIKGVSINHLPPPANGEDAIVVYQTNQEEIQDVEMMNNLAVVEEDATVREQTTQCQLTIHTYIDSIVIITPLKEFHAQLKRNSETKRIKSAFTSARLTDTAKRVSNIIGRKPLSQQPVLVAIWINSLALRLIALSA